MMSRRGMIAASVGSVAAVGAGAIPAMCAGKIYPGVEVAGIDVSGMTPEAARGHLEQELSAFTAHALTFELGTRQWHASLADLGMTIDYDTILETALSSVREHGVLHRYSSFMDDATRYPVPLHLQQDGEGLGSFLGGIAAEVAEEPVDARIYKSGMAVEVLPDRAGRSLDVAHAKSEARRLLQAATTGVVKLRTSPIAPDVTAVDLEGAKAEAARMVGEPIVLTHNDAEYVFNTDHLGAALTIGEDNSLTFSRDALQERVDQIAAAVMVPARDAKVGWDGGLYLVQPESDGVRLDQDALIELLDEASRLEDRIAVLPVTVEKAAVRADNLETLGIEGMLASGSSSFAGSSYERAANVAASAHNVSYKLVAPGEEFSFNRLLGPITEEYGYIAGSIIQGDFAATDIGGGVCQVSTTVFRAALNAGFRFSEWNPHSWRLAFYEADGSAPGQDAAIYQPNNEWEYELDLRFVNPLDSWLLLQVIVEGDWVTASFYGRHPGWDVEVFPAEVSDPKPIPEPVERVNANLAPGDRRRVQLASPGYTVRVRRTVTDRAGALVSDGEFVSDYVSQPEAWEVGPS